MSLGAALLGLSDVGMSGELVVTGLEAFNANEVFGFQYREKGGYGCG